MYLRLQIWLFWVSILNCEGGIDLPQTKASVFVAREGVWADRGSCSEIQSEMKSP